MTEQEKKALLRLMQSPDFRVLESVIESMCQDIQSREKTRDTEWETLKNVLMDEGQVRGLRQLITSIMENIKDV